MSPQPSALSVAYAVAGRTDEALALVAGAVNEFRAGRGHGSPSNTLFYAGRAYLAAGRIDEATDYAREALALARRRGARGIEARALFLTADIAAASGAENAEGYYREALTLAEPRGMCPLVAHCHLGLGKLDRRIGDREQAQEHLTTATDVPRNGHDLLAGASGSGAAPAGLVMWAIKHIAPDHHLVHGDIADRRVRL